MHLVILGLAAAAQTIEADRPEQGKMPRGWTYARHCRRCRPVWGWLLRDGKPVALAVDLAAVGALDMENMQ